MLWRVKYRQHVTQSWTWILLPDDGRARCGLSRNRFGCAGLIATDCSVCGSLQISGYLVDAGLGAGLVLVAARRTGHPDCADRFVADLDRQCTLRRGDVGQEKCTGIRVAFDTLRKFAGRP